MNPILAKAIIRSVLLHEANFAMEKALKELKELAESGQLSHEELVTRVEALEAQRETFYIEACEQIIARQDIGRYADELQAMYDELATFSESAYYTGYQDGLKEQLSKLGHDEFLDWWVAHILGPDAARRLLDAGDEEEGET